MPGRFESWKERINSGAVNELLEYPCVLVPPGCRLRTRRNVSITASLRLRFSRRAAGSPRVKMLAYKGTKRYR